MVHANLRGVLEATGYLADGQPAHGVLLGKDARDLHRNKEFVPDALWRSDESALKWRDDSALTVYFKREPKAPSDDRVAVWRREIWNRGFAPLLWVVSPEKIDVYNGFGRPEQDGDADTHRLDTFTRIAEELERLDGFAGRLAMETGRFWETVPQVNRKTSVDRQLLRDLHALERDLVSAKLNRPDAQGLIGRSIFAQYLIDREIVTPKFLKDKYGHRKLAAILRERAATEHLFDWLRDTFNGDMFSPEDSPLPEATKTEHLRKVADFLDGTEPESGQHTLFPYQFDVIPVELISSIYEQFANAESQPGGAGAKPDVFYTRLSLVSLILDEIMDGLKGTETVLDLTCGSGVFLVEALRRLVDLRSGGKKPSRKTIRSVLHKQIYGVDISEPAVHVAAFSLYLAALELDPDPKPPDALKFEPLINRTLIVGDAWNVDSATPEGKAALRTKSGDRKIFDVIVGNPPWSYRGKSGREARHLTDNEKEARSPRGESLDFVRRARDFSSDKTRFGLVLSAVQFFSRSATGVRALRRLMEKLSPLTLVNLSCQSNWLFPNATLPAIVLLTKGRDSDPGENITAVQIPWSPSSAQTHMFEVSRDDIITLPPTVWRRDGFLKAMFFGLRRDLALLDKLISGYSMLGDRLRKTGTKLRAGLKIGNQSRESRFLHGMPLLTKNDLHRLWIPDNLASYTDEKAEGPRKHAIYKAPLLLVRDFLRSDGRPTAAMARRDLVFADAFYGAALPSSRSDDGHILAAILNSSLASWFFLMTASTFGLSMRRLLLRDVEHLPVPEFGAAERSEVGRRVARISREAPPGGYRNEKKLLMLDEAVFDLYDLDRTDRIVVRDGLFRATWQWAHGRRESATPSDPRSHILEYARVFLEAIDVWFSAANRHHMRAEVLEFPASAPLRIVRFVIEEGSGPSICSVVQPDGALRDVLRDIGERLYPQIGTSLRGQQALRVYGPDEVVIIKPSARRHWMRVSALEDADAVVMDSLVGQIT